MPALLYEIALSCIPSIGDKNAKHLVSYCGSAENVFKSNKNQLLKIPGIGQKTVQTIMSENSLKEAEHILNESTKNNVQITSYYSSLYPKNLKQTIDSPLILFSKGNIELNEKKTVAIVGTRKATPYGKMVTEKIVADLASLNVCIVSGLAYGIDIHAHKAALKHNLTTMGVLAGGLDRIYPSIHKKYVNEIIDTGGSIISENKLGTIPNPPKFPARNRIIAGISDLTIVVEAASKGGALITANLADSYNRPVFAIPGNLGNTYSEGTNQLISTQKAIIYTNVNDLIKQMNWDLIPSQKTDTAKEEPSQLSEEDATIYNFLKENSQAVEIDIISIKTQLAINKVASSLLNLEFQNLVKSLPGKKYQLL